MVLKRWEESALALCFLGFPRCACVCLSASVCSSMAWAKVPSMDDVLFVHVKVHVKVETLGSLVYLVMPFPSTFPNPRKHHWFVYLLVTVQVRLRPIHTIQSFPYHTIQCCFPFITTQAQGGTNNQQLFIHWL